MYSPSIQKLIEKFSKFPTVGPRTAARFVFYLLKLSKEEIEDLLNSISNLKKNLKTCSLCFNAFEPAQVSSKFEAVDELRSSSRTELLRSKSEGREENKVFFSFANARVGEGEGEFCQICSNQTRNKNLLCIVANETDLTAIEKTKKYKGLYLILGGTVSALKKTDIEKLRIKELEARVKNHPEIQEIIIAINPTPDGEATTLYLERLLKPFNKKITRLGRGLPVGGELEYADEETLSSALESRR